jgi:glutamate-1-semialdehyde 2,1-aminomutase
MNPAPPRTSQFFLADRHTADDTTQMKSSTALPGSGTSRAADREFFERELASFLPDKIFDAHCHLWLSEEVSWSVPDFPGSVGFDEYVRLMNDLHPGRRLAALFIGFATPDRPEGVARGNAWIAQQVARDPASFRGEFFVRPGDDPEWVRQEVRRLKLHGLKCYHTFAPIAPTWEAGIPDFLPEPLVKVAHEEGWVITLHMVKSRACADPANIDCIRRYCKAYPNMRLILAHSARGFQPAHNLEGLPHLKGLDNLYLDTSANCEPLAHQAVIRILGHKRLMYGSDLPVSHSRGRSVAAADSFFFVDRETPVWQAKQLSFEPVLLGLEHLRSIKWACWSERVSDEAVEDIFWKNAAGLLGVS